MVKALKIALFIAIFLPSTAFAATFTTPSGVVVDEMGRIVAMPVTLIKPVIKPLFTGDPKKICRTPLKGYQYGKPSGDNCRIWLAQNK